MYYLVIVMLVIATGSAILTMIRLPKNKMNNKRWRGLTRNVILCFLFVFLLFICTSYYSMGLYAERTEEISNVLLEPLNPDSKTYLFDTGTKIYYKSNGKIMSNDSEETKIIESDSINPQISEYEIEYVHQNEMFWKILLGKKVKKNYKAYRIYIPREGKISEARKKINY
ncbi:MAG: hypothetical protein PHR25_03435 [Clostridia bacterium]|nr:hypothetical protein [Clostridia bacterium]MDD4375814.1 hypothetical protein [Clostridia bacterium]